MTIAKLYRYELSCDGYGCESTCIIETRTKYSLKNTYYKVPDDNDIPDGWDVVKINGSLYSPLQQLVCKSCLEAKNYNR